MNNTHPDLFVIGNEINKSIKIDEIRELKHDIVNKLGLGPSLSARRQVGMMSMVDHIKIITGAK